jgi:hypothetical protein
LDPARHTRLCGQPGYGNATDAQLNAKKSQMAPAGLGAGPRREEEEEEEEGMLSMWVFLSARLRTWLLLAIALPLARLLVHRLAVAAERRDASARAAKLLRRADSAVTAVSGRASRRARR